LTASVKGLSLTKQCCDKAILSSFLKEDSKFGV